MLSSTDVDSFLADPSAYFGYSLTKMVGLPRDVYDELQIAGLKQRFAQYRGSLPMLDKLADSQGINSINELNDVLPLLFDHAVYKSYLPSLLEKHRYAQLTTWLNKLTTVDLSHVDVSDCSNIDEWIIKLTRETPLALCHTSGTTGTMSFLPWSKNEFHRFLRFWTVLMFTRFGEDESAPAIPLNIDCLYPFFRSGGTGHTVLNDTIVEMIAGDEEHFHALYPQRLSSDLMLLAARRRAAVAAGHLDRLEITPELAARRDEFETQQREMPQRATEFFAIMRTKLAGKRVFMQATSNLLYTLAENGLKQGLRGVFDPSSIISAGGGGKGIVLPANWADVVKEFFGVDFIFNHYGMTEMTGLFTACEHGHYHGVPWIIPFVLDPETAKPLPREGIVTGRFGFYDLLPDTRWGGFITGDEVTFDWDTRCPCGRTTPFVTGEIRRLGDKKADGGEEKISCAATPAAYAEALEFLNESAT